jgi:hypothetical protein
MKEFVLKIVSGGQTGADMGALKAAKNKEIPTGGCLPNGCKTENGSDPTLKIKFNMYESSSSDYKVRTEENVRRTDATVILSGVKSRGSELTKSLCGKLGKDCLLIDPNDVKASEKIMDFVKQISLRKERKIILNVAGNRESKSPGIEKKTAEILEKCFSL